MTAANGEPGRDTQNLAFGSFRLDLRNKRVWRGKVEVILRPKPFSVLAYLVQHAGELITKNALIEALWPELHVSDGVLVEYVSEIRKALKDSARQPRYIKTIHRQGYRFLAPVTGGSLLPLASTSDQPVRTHLSSEESSELLEAGTKSRLPTVALGEPTVIDSPLLVGRTREIAFLQQRLSLASAGQASLLFVTGPAGIGKTSLVHQLRKDAGQKGFLWLEGHYDQAANRPYQAWVEIMRRSLQYTNRQSLAVILGEYAASLARLVPEIDATVAGASSKQIDPEGERLRLFEAVTHLFVCVSQQTPLVLIQA